jgi:predicted transcriptional regulator
MLTHAVFDSLDFETTLKPIDALVLLLLIRKHNRRNNGDIALGVRETAARCHCSQMTACRSLERLQKAGLITVTYKGHLVPEIGRPDIATRWRLNFVEDPPNEERHGIVIKLKSRQ